MQHGRRSKHFSSSAVYISVQEEDMITGTGMSIPMSIPEDQGDELLTRVVYDHLLGRIQSTLSAMHGYGREHPNEYPQDPEDGGRAP
jgi:hypothetical protein